jgi:hypothetical protein
MSQQEEKVNTLINEFDEWFQTKGNDPIVRSERAILKTFFWWVFQVKRLEELVKHLSG